MEKVQEKEGARAGEEEVVLKAKEEVCQNQPISQLSLRKEDYTLPQGKKGKVKVVQNLVNRGKVWREAGVKELKIISRQ